MMIAAGYGQASSARAVRKLKDSQRRRSDCRDVHRAGHHDLVSPIDPITCAAGKDATRSRGPQVTPGWDGTASNGLAQCSLTTASTNVQKRSDMLPAAECNHLLMRFEN